MKDVNKECISYIRSIGCIGQNIADGIQKISWSGFKEYQFTENDLKYIKAKHEELFDVWNNLPNLTVGRPAGCEFKFKPERYPCNECEANKQDYCLDLEELNKVLKEIENVKSN